MGSPLPAAGVEAHLSYLSRAVDSCNAYNTCNALSHQRRWLSPKSSWFAGLRWAWLSAPANQEQRWNRVDLLHVASKSGSDCSNISTSCLKFLEPECCLAVIKSRPPLLLTSSTPYPVQVSSCWLRNSTQDFWPSDYKERAEDWWCSRDPSSAGRHTPFDAFTINVILQRGNQESY